MSKRIKTFNSVSLVARSSIVAGKNTKSACIEDHMLQAFNHELINLGFYLSDDAMNHLRYVSKKDFKDIVDTTFKTLTDMLGAYVVFRPLYEGFPHHEVDKGSVVRNSRVVNQELVDFLEQFHDASETIDEYTTLSCGHKVAEFMTQASCPICEGEQLDVQFTIGQAKNVKVHSRLKEIKLISEEELFDYVRSCISSKTGMSPEQEKDLSAMMQILTEDEIKSLVSVEMPFKETVAKVVGLLSSYFSYKTVYDLTKNSVKTAKDVMRVAEKVNASEDYRKFKLTNSYRKLIAAYLDSIKNPLEDMVKEREKWVALNMAVHFGVFRKKYENAFKAVNTVLNKPETIKTFEGKLQVALVDEKNIDKVVKLAKQRPGIFARNLDNYIRKFPESIDLITDALKDCGSSASMRVLVGARDNFSSRLNDHNVPRMYINKRGFSNIIDKDREDISEENCKKVIAAIDEVIKQKLVDSQYDGKSIFIDPSLSTRVLPMKMRSMKNSMFKAERGSSIKIDEDTDYIRFFTYWKENDESGRVDLDLSTSIFYKNFDQLETCAYYDTHGEYSTHSGDFTSAPNGATEFVDINIGKLKKTNASYVVMYVNVFSRQSLDSFDAFCGVMCNNNGVFDKTYDPLKVVDRFDLTCDARAVLALIYDIENNTMLWADMPSHNLAGSNIGSQMSVIENQINYIMNINESFMKMQDYFNLFAEANNMIVVDDPESADMVIDNSLVKNTDKFNSEWLK